MLPDGGSRSRVRPNHCPGVLQMFRRVSALVPLIAGFALLGVTAVFGQSAQAPGQASSPAPAPGWPATLPSGIYASPDCEAPSEIWVIAAGQELFADGDHFYLAELEPQSDPIIHGWRRYEGFFARAFPTGPVEYVTWVGEEGAEPEGAGWIDALPPTLAGLDEEKWFGIRHVPCAAVPLPFSALHGESANFMLAVEPAIAACSGGEGDCIGAMFAAVDKHPDGRLVTAELSRFVRVLLHLGIASQDEPKADESAGAQVASLAVAPLAATAIIASYDYDGDGSLSPSELAGELAGAGRLAISGDKASTSTQMRDAMRQARRGIEQLLPLLEKLD